MLLSRWFPTIRISRCRQTETLDYSKAKNTVSAYDLNAIEAAAQLAAANEGSNVVAVTVGGADIDDSKLKKNVLAAAWTSCT